MRQSYKKYVSLFQSYKKFIFAGFFCFLFLLIFFFPYQEILEKKLIELSQRHSSIQIEHQGVFIGVFPPRITLKEVWLQSPYLKSPLFILKLDIKPYYLALLAFRPSIHLEIYFKKGRIRLLLKKQEYKRQEQIHIHTLARSVEIDNFKSILPLLKGAKGVMDLQLNLAFSPPTLSHLDGDLEFQIRPLELQPYSLVFPKLGSLNLPLLKWKKAQGSIKISKGRLQWQPLVVGSQEDEFYINTKGFLNYKNRGLKPIIQNYNLDLRLQMNKDLESRFALLDLFLLKTKTQISPRRAEYKVNIFGTGFSPPKIEAL